MGLVQLERRQRQHALEHGRVADVDPRPAAARRRLICVEAAASALGRPAFAAAAEQRRRSRLERLLERSADSHGSWCSADGHVGRAGPARAIVAVGQPVARPGTGRAVAAAGPAAGTERLRVEPASADRFAWPATAYTAVSWSAAAAAVERPAAERMERPAAERLERSAERRRLRHRPDKDSPVIRRQWSFAYSLGPF